MFWKSKVKSKLTKKKKKNRWKFVKIFLNNFFLMEHKVNTHFGFNVSNYTRFLVKKLFLLKYSSRLYCKTNKEKEKLFCLTNPTHTSLTHSYTLKLAMHTLIYDVLETLYDFLWLIMYLAQVLCYFMFVVSSTYCY